MKTPFKCFVALAVSGVLLNGCGSPAPSAGTGPTLTLVVNGVPTAPVAVTRSGTTVFQGQVTGSKTLSGLPQGAYTVTASDVVGFVSPAPQNVELNDSRSLALTYTRSEVPTQFTVRLGVSSAALGPGDQLDVPVHVEALRGFRGTVRLSVTGLPSGISATSTVLDVSAGTAVDGHLTLTAARTLGAGQFALTVIAATPDPAESIALPLSVMALPPVVRVQAPFTRVYVPTPVDIPISLSGLTYAGAATLSVDGLPKGVTAALPSSVTLGSTPTTVSLRLSAGPDAPLGDPSPTLIVSAKGQRLYLPLSVNVQPQRFAVGDVSGASVYALTADTGGAAWYTTWNELRRISADGTRASYPISSYLLQMQATADGLVYGAINQDIVRVNPSTGQTTRWYLGEYDRPSSTDFNGAGTFLVLDASRVLYPSTAALTTYGFSTLDLTTGASRYAQVAGIVGFPRFATRVASTVYFVAHDGTTERLYRFNLDTGESASFADERTTGVESLSASPDGRVWLTRASTVGGSVRRELVLFDPPSGLARVLPQVTVEDATRVVATPDGSAWVVGLSSPKVQHVDARSGSVRPFDPVGVPNQIAVSGRGDLWYSFEDSDGTYVSHVR